MKKEMELWESAEKLATNCIESHFDSERHVCVMKDGKVCPFNNKEKGGCLIGDDLPSDWGVVQFREADKKLAVALDLFGYTRICRRPGKKFCEAENYAFEGNILFYPLPDDAFKSLKEGDSVCIRDIIREGEE